MIISRNGKDSFSDIMRDLKKYTATRIIEAIESNSIDRQKKWLLEKFETAGRSNPNNTKFQIWQQDNHPIELVTNFEIEQKLDYLHNNPVKKGIVELEENYVWSSAIDYSGGKGLVDISLIE
jgi:hypothetical protein